MDFPMWFELWEKHKGKLLGTLGGIFFSIIYLNFGFRDMVVCVFLLLIGYALGKKHDKREPWFSKWSERIRNKLK